MKSLYVLSEIVSSYALEVRKLPKCKIVIAAYRVHKPYTIIEDVFSGRYAVNFKSVSEALGLIS